MDNEGKIPNLENDTYNYNLNLIFCTEKDVYLTFLFYSKKSTSRSIIPFFTMKQVPSLTNNIYSVCLIVIDLLCSTLHRKALTKTLCFHFSCAQKMMFFSKDFFTKCDQIRTFLWVWSHLLKKSSQKTSFLCSAVSNLEIGSSIRKMMIIELSIHTSCKNQRSIKSLAH